MSIVTDYAGLQTEIANYLSRDDLTADIPGFIRLAELRLRRRLRVRDMEARLTLDTVASQRWYGLPERYRAMRHFQLNTNPITDLEYLTPQLFFQKWAGSNSGKPVAYTIVGDEFALGPFPDGVYEMEMFTHRHYAFLSDTNTTNWLISDLVDILIHGSLMEANLFIKDTEEAIKFENKFESGLKETKKDDALDRHSGGALMTVPDSPRY